MDELRYKIYKLVFGSDDVNEAIDNGLDFFLDLKHTLSHNNKQVIPPHDVYPIGADKEINDVIVRKAEELGLKIVHVELKAPGVKTSKD